MKKNKLSNQWLQSQNKDPYVKKARESHFRSRAVYKLQEIDKKDKLIKPNYCVVDLGSSPGSWAQYLSSIIDSRGRIIAIDILPMDPIDQVFYIPGDFTNEIVQKECLRQAGKQGADLVISDMAPNMSGMAEVDIPNAMGLVELALDMAQQVLKPGGVFVAKVFQGEGFDALLAEMRKSFGTVVSRKPDSSRARSREIYQVCKGFKG